MSSQQITEISIFRLREGVDLGNVTSSSPDPTVKGFLQLTRELKGQMGFSRQFWGHEVEHPTLFVWVTDWESFEHNAEWVNSKEQTLLMADLAQIFDLESGAPFKLYTRVSDPKAATAAFRSGVTEVAFYTMPTRPDEETRSAVEASSGDVIRDVQEIGKASGAAIGWVFDAEPKAVVSGSDSVCVYGVFGYAGINVHMKWRETPEAKKYGEPSDTVRPATVVPGIDPETGYFHVNFQEGV